MRLLRSIVRFWFGIQALGFCHQHGFHCAPLLLLPHWFHGPALDRESLGPLAEA